MTGWALVKAHFVGVTQIHFKPQEVTILLLLLVTMSRFLGSLQQLLVGREEAFY